MESIDIFGRNSGSLAGGVRGPRGFRGATGARGPPGVGSIDSMARWFPKMTLTETRFNEFCCLKINDPKTDLEIDEETLNIKKWNSLLSKSNNFATVLENFYAKEYTLIRDNIYGLKFSGQSLYRILNAGLFPFKANHWVWTCMTFRPLNIDVTEEQYLFSNANDTKLFRGVSITNKSIKIWGSDNAPNYFVDIVTNEPLVGKWITVFVFWTNIDARTGYYVVLLEKGVRLEGHFICQRSTRFQQEFIDVGGIYNPVKSEDVVFGFKGLLACFELYVEHEAKESTYPDKFMNLVMENQQNVSM